MTTHEVRPPQRAIIEALDRHVLVAAGAGSGKTTTVVNALLHRLGVPVLGAPHPEPITLDDLAAITFTTAAASELVTKLRDALVVANAKELAEQLDTARIGTIHGFCGDLLRSLGLRGTRRAAGAVILEGQARELLASAASDALLDAVEVGDLPGLGIILANHRLSSVSKWIALLAEDGGRLAALRQLPTIGTAEVQATLVTLAERARARMDVALAELPAVDFDRLLVWTRDLLADPDDASVRVAARRRLKLLVVDEFQDVDPVQRDIVNLLGGIEPREPSITKLLLVGDPKQSIYRFRRADVSVWRQVEATFAGMGDAAVTLPLNESFRSVPAILAFVDHALGPGMAPGSDAAPYEVAYQSLRPTREAVGPAKAVEIIAQRTADDDEVKAEARRPFEARAVVERLKYLHGQPLVGAEHEPLEWRHMAILVPARAAMRHFADACRAADVPFYLLSNEGLLGAREVLDAILALRAVRDPRDRVAMAGVLRSPFVGLRDDTLLALAQGGGLDSDRSSVAIASDESARLAEGRAWLERARQRRDRVSVHALLEQLLDESGYRAHLALRGDDDAKQALANLSQFVRMLESEPHRSTGGWLRELAERRARQDDVAPARLVGPDEPFVTITTIHAAKGLDWEVVVWGDLGRKPKDDHGVDGLFVTRSGMGIKAPDVEWDDQAPALIALRDEARREAKAERMRLRYVAATRAKTRLIVSGVDLKAEQGSDAEWLCGALGLGADQTSGPITVRSAAGGAHSVDVSVIELHAGDGAGARALPPARVPLAPVERMPVAREAFDVPSGRLRHSATALMLHAGCERRYAWKYLLGVAEPEGDRGRDAGNAGDAEPRTGGERDGGDEPTTMDARTRGTIVHEILARAAESQDLDVLLGEAEQQWSEDDEAPGAGWDAADRAVIREQVERALAGRYGELAARPHARRELRFLRVLPNGSALEGALDLAAPDGDGVAIVDVKTGGVRSGEEAEAAARYAGQRRVYTEAVEAISGRAVTRFEFLFTETMATEAGVRDDAPRRVVEQVAAAERTRMEQTALASDPTVCLGCGYKRVGWCRGARWTRSTPAAT